MNGGRDRRHSRITKLFLDFLFTQHTSLVTLLTPFSAASIVSLKVSDRTFPPCNIRCTYSGAPQALQVPRINCLRPQGISKHGNPFASSGHGARLYKHIHTLAWLDFPQRPSHSLRSPQRTSSHFSQRDRIATATSLYISKNIRNHNLFQHQ